MRSKFMKSVTSLMLGACMLNPAVAGFNYPSASAADLSVSGTDGDYAYSMMSVDNVGKAVMDQSENGGFSCRWNSVRNAEFKKGFVYESPISTDSIQKLDLSYTSEFMPMGKAAFGVKGSFSGDDADFCIVEASCDWTVPENAVMHHECVIDGRNYKIYTSEKDGKTTYWSVGDKIVKTSRLTYIQNPLSFAEHLRAWELAGLGGVRVADLYAFVDAEDCDGTAFIKDFTVTDKYFIQELVRPVTTTAPADVATTTSTRTTVAAGTMTTVPVTTVAAVADDYNLQGTIAEIGYRIWDKENKGNVNCVYNPETGISTFVWNGSAETRALYGCEFGNPAGNSTSWSLDIEYEGNIIADGETYYGVSGEMVDGRMIDIIEGWSSVDPSLGMEYIDTYSIDDKKYKLYVKENADVILSDGTSGIRDLYRCVAVKNAFKEEEDTAFSGTVNIGSHFGKLLNYDLDPANLRSVYFGCHSEQSSGAFGLSTLNINDVYTSSSMNPYSAPDTDPDEIIYVDEELELPLLPAENNTVLHNETDETGNFIEIQGSISNGKIGYEKGDNSDFEVAWKNTYETIINKGRQFGEKQYTLDCIDNFDVIYDIDITTDSYSKYGAYVILEPKKSGYRNYITEMYVVDGYGAWRPPGTEKEGSFVSGGVTYDLYKKEFNVTPGEMSSSITTITQYWSVVADNQLESGKTTAESGHIRLEDHIAQWEKLGLNVEGEFVHRACFYADGFESTGRLKVNSLDFVENYHESSYPDFPMEPMVSVNGTGVLCDRTDELGNRIYAYNQGDHGKVSFEVSPDGFDAAWAGEEYALFFKGKKFTPNTVGVTDLENLKVDYEIEYFDNNSSTFGLWGQLSNGDVFYIMDGHGKWNPMADTKPIYTIVSGGVTYNVYKYLMNGGGDIFGTRAHYCYYSIPVETPVRLGEPVHICHTIDLKPHVEAWVKAGMADVHVEELNFQIEALNSYGYAYINKLYFNTEVLDPLTVPTKDDVVRENFENNNYAMFRSDNGSKITYTDERNFSGYNSMRVTPPAGKGASFYYKPIENVFVPGETYSLYFNILNTASKNAEVKAYIDFGSAETAPKPIEIGRIVADSGEWTTFTCPGITLPEFSGTVPKVVVTAGADEAVYIDNFIIKRVRDDAEYELSDKLPGDLNGDGVVNVFDVVLCRAELCKMLEGEEYSNAADVNRDGEVSVSDLILISGYTMGKCDNLNGRTKAQSMSIIKHDDYYCFEIWNADNEGEVNYNFAKNGCFSVDWDGVSDFIADTKPTVLNPSNTLPVLRYEGTFDADDNGTAYYGAYGWFTDSLTEYFVIDGWRGSKPKSDTEPDMTLEIGGKTYDVYKEVKVQPCILGTSERVVRYFSIARENGADGNGKCSISGEISLKEHVETWRSLYKDNIDNKSLHSFGAFVESLNGNKGEAVLTKGTIYRY